MKPLDAADELMPRIRAHPLASMERVLDRQGPLWDVIQQHPLYDEETTDFLDPLRLSDQAVFRDGSVLTWSLADGWLVRRGEHNPFPHVRLIRHDGKRWQRLERLTGEVDGRGDWRDVTPVSAGG